MRSVSQIPGLAGAIGRNRFLCKGIKLSGRGVAFDCCVEAFSLEHFEPRAKTRQLLRRKLLDGLLDFFGGCHDDNITFVAAA